MKKKILTISFILSIAVLLLTITLNSKISFSEDNEETEEKQLQTYNWGRDKCPINVFGLVATSYINKDFTKLSIEDYEAKTDEFSYKLKNSLISELSQISYEQYGTSIDFESMEKIANGETPPLLNEQVTPEQSMELVNKIKDCFHRGLKIATTVQKAIVATETQSYVTNSLLEMTQNVQDILNIYRTDKLEKEAKQGSKFTIYPLNPIK